MEVEAPNSTKRSGAHLQCQGWTPDEDAYLRDAYDRGDTTQTAMAAHLKRSVGSVAGRLERLRRGGLKPRKAIWSAEADALVHQRWREGVSFSQIAESLNRSGLGNWSRNAVIGRAHRLGLRGRSPDAKPMRSPPRRRGAPVSPMRKPARIQESPAPTAPMSRNFQLAQMEAFMCRFITGDPKGEHTYCAANGYPWCPHHFRIVYPGAHAQVTALAA